jgi:hypothetical protein
VKLSGSDRDVHHLDKAKEHLQSKGQVSKKEREAAFVVLKGHHDMPLLIGKSPKSNINNESFTKIAIEN